MKAIIIGGGIAGLAAAKGLQRIGWEVAVYERAPVLKALGAGLVLSANALKALRALGLLEVVLAIGQPLNNFKILSKKGRVLADTNHLLLNERFGIQSCISVHRGDLQQVLLDRLAPLQVYTGKCFKSLEQDEQQITVSFEDGTLASADLLIGCDGVHSAVRQQLVPEPKKRYAGYTCWRGITEKQPAGLPLHQATESWGRGDRFGIVPLTNEGVYWFACLNAPQQQDPKMKATGLAELKQQFHSYHQPVQELLDLTPAANLLWNDIVDLEPLSTYVYGRAVLLGDAAHATTPNMGQGACQALEGAAVLIGQLANLPLRKALQLYDKKRVSRASSIVKQSWQLGKVAQASSPLGVWLRDHLLPLVPSAINDRQMQELLGIELPDIPSYSQESGILQESR